MRFPIHDRTLTEAFKRYDLSRRSRYGSDKGADPFNPGHRSRVLGIAIENQISIWLWGKPSGYTDIKASTDGGFDLKLQGRKWDVKANNVDNAGSWLISHPKSEPDDRDPDTVFLCVNGHLTDVNDPLNRSFYIMGYITLAQVKERSALKWYPFGQYYRVVEADLNPINDMRDLPAAI